MTSGRQFRLRRMQMERQQQEQALPSPSRQQGGIARATGGMVRDPNDVCANGRMAAFVHGTRHTQRPDNTTFAYEPKKAEFEEFCQINYSNDPYKHNISQEKVYRFLFYTSFREQKARGGKKRSNNEAKFNQDEYLKLTGTFFNPSSADFIFPNPTKPISPATFNTYKHVIKNIHREQRCAGVCNIPWDLVWTTNCDDLQKHVKERLPHIKKANFVEKIDGEFAPYTIVERYDEIEDAMWKDSASARGSRNICSNLRHRACTLYLTSGILRSESAHHADISDFFGLRPPRKEKDVHDMWLLINQIPQGKTTHGKKQWGRATRHKDVKLCCCGGIAFYLSYRIYLTGEFSDMSCEEWLDNAHWFNIKFLVDVNGSDNTKEMKSDTFSSHIKLVLKRLGLPHNKLLHLGRNLGTKILDLQEISAEEVKRMGQWNQSVVDNSYSSKLPMNAIRNLAGFSGGLYYSTRTTVMPSRELAKMAPLGFAFDMLPRVCDMDCDGDHPTAVEVLRFFCDMSVILMQDAAAMMVLHPEREEHGMFESIPVFNTPEFKSYKEEMRVALETDVSPLDADLERVLPGVHQRLHVNHQATLQLDRKFDRTMNELNTTVTNGFQHIAQVTVNGTEEILGHSLVDAGSRLIHQNLSVDSTDSSPEQGSPSRNSALDAFRRDLTGIDEPAMLTGTNNNNCPDSPTTMSPNSNPSDDCHRHFRMCMKHQSLMDVWDEWHGLGSFCDEYGGIKGCNKQFGARWRKHLPQSQYSYHNRLIKGAMAEAVSTNQQPTDIIQEWEALFEASKNSVGNLVKALQRLNKIKVGKARGKKVVQ